MNVISAECAAAQQPVIIAIKLLSIAIEAVQKVGAVGTVASKGAEIRLPTGYKSWPKFPFEAGRGIKQIHELYVNPAGAKVVQGQPFANGTAMVMEVYKAKERAGRNLEPGYNGEVIKGPLLETFVLGKRKGWRRQASDSMTDDPWVCAVYRPDGKPLVEDFTKCRACHAPLAQKDFVHRYDEYFEARLKR